MIFSRRLGFAFFRIPKTASTTAEVMLRLSGAFTEDDALTALPSVHLPERNLEYISLETIEERLSADGIGSLYSTNAGREFIRDTILGHMTPKQAVDLGLATPDELLASACFSVVRNPADRYLSAYRYAFPRTATPEAFRNHLASGELLPLFGRSQIDYFYLAEKRVLTPLRFDQFEVELKRTIRAIGGYIGEEVPRFKAAQNHWLDAPDQRWYDDAAMRRIRKYFAADFDLYDELGYSSSSATKML